MESIQSTVQRLIEKPAESLAVELKCWIDPEKPEGIAKIVRGSLALKNHGGGYLLVGFNDRTLMPETPAPPDVRNQFHGDVIQALISKYASEPFEVAVEFPELNGQPYPVIRIPPGIRTPIAAKAELVGTSKKLICIGDVYVRSLRSNNMVSTTVAKWNDWPRVVEVCFENREADIGRFLRRHLSPTSPEAAQHISAMFRDIHKATPTAEERVFAFLEESANRFTAAIADRKLPDFGSWEVALELTRVVGEYRADDAFFNLLSSSNPRLTGWPIWMDSRGFRDPASQPHVYQEKWEALIIDISSERPTGIDFIRLDPKGRFYQKRTLEDDINKGPFKPEAGTALDVDIPVLRCAEAMAVGITFAKALGCIGEGCFLNFGFRWKKLSGRRLSTWSRPGTGFGPERTAHQPEVKSFVSLPAEIPVSALGPYVHHVVRPLFECFGGYTISINSVEQLLRQLLDRRGV